MAISPGQQQDEVHLPDGRVTLADPARAGDSRYTNGDLAPVPIERRTWNTYNYTALWVGMSHNIPSYLLASGLIALGMNWVQAVLTIALGNLIVLAPMLLNSHAGTKYGIPFPVFARASFGLRGSQPGGRAAGPDRVRLVRDPDLDRRRGHLHPGRGHLRQRLDQRRSHRRVPLDAVAVLRDLLGHRDGHHRARHGHTAPVRELGRAVRARGRGRAARLHGDQGARLRRGPFAAVQARLGQQLLAGVLPVADGHDRVLVNPVAEHAGLHQVRPQPAGPGRRARCWGCPPP